ncbi:YeiH family protein [Candidatus Phycosocius spiralis]|nr:putative sulfate exporter family transporter [Candidatus Phycosocius spiralis]
MFKSVAKYGPGVGVGIALAALAYFPTQGTRVPTLLVALLLGMAAAFILNQPAFKSGNDVLAKPLLRIGVALMGFRITISDLQILGWQPALIAMAATFGTLGLGYLAGRALFLPRATAFLTAASVAICGASAALAIATVLARRPNSQVERDVVATVATITILGTIAMVLYPAMCHYLNLPLIPSAVFLGATIHEVAQVVAASDLYGQAATPAATTVKMIRVAMLPIVIFGLMMILSLRDRTGLDDETHEATVPVFLLGFVAAIVVTNTGWLTHRGILALTQISNLCLVVSMVALGANTSIKGVMALGPQAVGALLVQTMIIAAISAAGIGMMIIMN